jgi:hypothetical protein
MRVHGAFFDEGIIFWCCNLFPAFLRGGLLPRGVAMSILPSRMKTEDRNTGVGFEARVSARRVRHKRPATHILPTTR